MTNVLPDPAEIVGSTLEGYARRGVFRSFSRLPGRGSRATYRITWHHNRAFDLVLDRERRTLRFPSLLDNVPAGPALYGPLAAFVRGRHSAELPEHRRIDIDRARVKSYRRAGKVSLTLEVLRGDYEYGTRKLIHLVHEIFLDFLREGPGYGYLVAQLGLEPDTY